MVITLHNFAFVRFKATVSKDRQTVVMILYLFTNINLQITNIIFNYRLQ